MTAFECQTATSGSFVILVKLQKTFQLLQNKIRNIVPLINEIVIYPLVC